MANEIDWASASTEQVTGLVQQGLQALRDLRADTQPEAIEAVIASKMREPMQRWTVGGRLVPAAVQALQETEDMEREALSETFRVRARTLKVGLPEIARGLPIHTEATKALVPAPTTGVDRLVELFEQQQLQRRFENRPLSELADHYARLPDAGLAAYLEAEQSRGFPELRPRVSAEDAAALTRLQTLIAERRERRVPQAVRDSAKAMAEEFHDFASQYLGSVITGHVARRPEPRRAAS